MWKFSQVFSSVGVQGQVEVHGSSARESEKEMERGMALVDACVERCYGHHGAPTIWASVVCGVLLQRTYFLKRAVPWCRVLCSVCCLVGLKKSERKRID